jgi:HSP20 family protein
MAKEKTVEKGKEKRAAAEPVPVVTRPAVPASRWDREVEQLFDRWFDDFRPVFRWPRLFGPERWLPSREIVSMPAVDVYDEQNEIVVKADLPGVTSDELDVTVSESRLTIKGEKKKEEEVKHEDYHRWERSYGAFTRTIDLPAPVKVDDVKATFKSGVLEVRLPKTEAAKQRSVKVEVQ